MQQEILQQYFTFLSANDSEQRFTGFLSKIDSSEPIKGYGKLYVTSQELIELLKVQDFPLHIVPAACKGASRKKGDALYPRVFLAELDRQIDETELKELIVEYQIQLAVESSPRKYHLYWQCRQEVSIEDWQAAQTAIAKKLDADIAFGSPVHTIRVPGVERITKDGEEFLPRIVWLVEEPRALSAEEICQTLKINPPKSAKQKPESRNRRLYDDIFQRVANGELRTLSEAEHWALQLAATFEEKDHSLEEQEVLTTARSAFENGCAHHQDKSTDPLAEARIVLGILKESGEQILRTEHGIVVWDSVNKNWKPQDREACGLVHRLVEHKLLELSECPWLMAQCQTKRGLDYGKLRREQRRLLRAANYPAMTGLILKSESLTKKEAAEFDADPVSFATQEALINMRSLHTKPFEIIDLVSKRSKVLYAPQAGCPRWLEFLQEIFAENESPAAMIELLKEVFGYSLSGYMGAERIFCHYGDGSNGKSKVLNALRHLAGTYGTSLDPDDLAVRKGRNAKAWERIGAKLEGYRLAVVQDISPKAIWEEGTVKTLTAPLIRARAEFERSREIPNRAKVHMGFNNAPEVESENFGILRRLCIIPYKRQFEPTAGASQAIDAMIAQEASGILNWAFEGLQEFLARGSKFEYPAEVQTAIEEYRQENFSLETALKECFELATKPDEYLNTHDALEAVNWWLGTQGKPRVSAVELGKGVHRTFKCSSTRRWCSKVNNCTRTYALKLKIDKNLYNGSHAYLV